MGTKSRLKYMEYQKFKPARRRLVQKYRGSTQKTHSDALVRCKHLNQSQQYGADAAQVIRN